MDKTDQANQVFRRVAQFLNTLQASGLKHVLISPGSRSTPLTLAAASLQKLQKRVILDERSAAFTALGIGKATQKPAALICTSGTAVANYFPAVIEAYKSRVPMLLLTADRPKHLQYTGANQMIDQEFIYGDYLAFYHDLGKMLVADDEESSPQELAGLFFHSSQSCRGPVHLNFPFSKPLEPTKDYLKTVQEEFDDFDDKPNASFQSNGKKNDMLGSDILHDISEFHRPLVIIGQLNPQTELEPIFRLARELKAPVLSEQGIIDSPLAIQGFEGFLRHEENRANLEPDLIFRFGREPASKSLLRAIKNWLPDRHIYCQENLALSNIEKTTTDYVDWVHLLLDFSTITRESYRWINYWKQFEERYFGHLNNRMAEQNCLTDGFIYHQLAPIIPAGWTISFSNSFPARDHSMFGRWNNQDVFTNRGVSGIDGITSTAMGVNIGSEKPGVLFTGDLAFLHDMGALLNHRKLSQPLVIVVINNQGGSIFRMLPVADYPKYFENYFETPQQADLTKIAEGYGVEAKIIDTIDKLKNLDIEKVVANMTQNVCVIECKTDPDESMNLRKNLWNTQYGDEY